MELKRIDRRNANRVAPPFGGVFLSWALAAASLAAAAPVDAGWMLRYIGRTNSEVLGDPRTAGTLRALLPAKLSEAVMSNLAGPPRAVLGKGGAIVLSACRVHDCGDKAFVWIAATPGAAWGATATCFARSGQAVHRWNACRVTVGSLAYAPGTVPQAAQDELKTWIADEDMQVVSMDFVGPDGIAHRLARDVQRGNGR